MASAGGGVGGRFLFRPGGGVGGRFALRPGGGVGGRFGLRPGGGVGGRAAGAEAMLSSSSKSNSICLYVSRYASPAHSFVTACHTQLPAVFLLLGQPVELCTAAG